MCFSINTKHIGVLGPATASPRPSLTNNEFLEGLKEELVLDCIVKIAALQDHRTVHRAQLQPVPQLLSTKILNCVLHSFRLYSLQVLPSGFVKRNDEADMSELGVEQSDEAQHELV